MWVQAVLPAVGRMKISMPLLNDVCLARDPEAVEEEVPGKHGCGIIILGGLTLVGGRRKIRVCLGRPGLGLSDGRLPKDKNASKQQEQQQRPCEPMAHESVLRSVNSVVPRPPE